MPRKLLGHVRQNAVAYLALFVALGGTTAYAANTINSSDIVDGQVTTADVRDDNLVFGGLYSPDLASGSVGTSEVANSSLSGADIQNSSLDGGDVAPDSLQGSDIATDTLTGTDINESTLNMPPTTTATFASTGFADLNDNDTFTKVVGKQLSAGSYAITATANIDGTFVSGADLDRDTTCELRNGTGFIGGAKDRRRTHNGERTRISLSMNGGAQVPAGGGEVSLWCLYQGGGATVGSSQMMIIRLDGFF